MSFLSSRTRTISHRRPALRESAPASQTAAAFTTVHSSSCPRSVRDPRRVGHGPSRWLDHRRPCCVSCRCPPGRLLCRAPRAARADAAPVLKRLVSGYPARLHGWVRCAPSLASATRVRLMPPHPMGVRAHPARRARRRPSPPSPPASPSSRRAWSVLCLGGFLRARRAHRGPLARLPRLRGVGLFAPGPAIVVSIQRAQVESCRWRHVFQVPRLPTRTPDLPGRVMPAESLCFPTN